MIENVSLLEAFINDFLLCTPRRVRKSLRVTSETASLTLYNSFSSMSHTAEAMIRLLYI